MFGKGWGELDKPLLIIGNKNYSSWSLRGWLAARKANMDFEEKRLPLDTPEFSKEIIHYSPTRRVPVLRDNGQVIWDSLAIAEYVNDAYADGALWPQDSTVRAIARAATAEMHSGFAALRGGMPMNIRASDRRVLQNDALAADIQRVIELWRTCRQEFGTEGSWLFGSFSIADAFYAPVTFRFTTYGVPLDTVEQEYVNHLQSDPDVRAWVAAALEETEVIEAEEVGVVE
ncbi:MAG: glutathione S-transferase family protein [Cyanobacteria bacterium J06638_20]